MEFLARDSDFDYAFRLQMEEALVASLYSRSQKPPSPLTVARSGFAIAVEDDRNGLRPESDSADVRIRNSELGEGSSKGKEKVYYTVTGVRNPNSRVGRFQNNTAGCENRRPSSVTQPQENVHLVQLVGEGSSKVNAAAGKFNGNVLSRLYCKGLMSEEVGKGKLTVLAGFGVAICDEKDNLLFEMKGPLIDCGMNRQGAEIKALTRGMTEALNLGIKRIAVCCDSYPIFQFVTGKWAPKQKKISMLMNDLQRIRQQFSLSQPVLVAGKDVKFAYKLARESIVSQVTPHEGPRQAKAARKEECVICYNDIEAERMFSVDKCRHRFCFQCVKQHVEVKLLHGVVPKCPSDGCKSDLVIDACGKLLTPKLSEMWKQRIKENAIPITERVYCPYPRCSALMSKTKISESAKNLPSLDPKSGVRRCVECRRLFCVDCKVKWHGELSCAEYKKLHPADDVKLKSLANNKMWRQCSKCQHMIELTQGCYHITCRCGHEFCYNCGGGWNKNTGTCTKRCPIWNEAYIMRQASVRGNVPPNNYFDDDDDEDYDDGDDEEEDYDDGDDEEEDYDDEDDEEEDYDDEDDEDFDYDYNGLYFHLGDDMNGRVLDHEDLFTDTARWFAQFPEDGFAEDLHPSYFHDDGFEDMNYYPVHTNTVPGNVSENREGQTEEMGQSHHSHSNAPSGNATTVNVPPANQFMGGEFDFYDYGDDDDDDDGFDDWDGTLASDDYDDYTDPFHPDYHQF